MQWCYKDPRCKKLQLPDLLVSPVQHVMRVPLVLRKIESRSDEDQEKAAINSILEAEESSLSESASVFVCILCGPCRKRPAAIVPHLGSMD